MEEKKLEQQKKNWSTPAGYTKRTDWNTKTNRNQTKKKHEEILLQIQQENLLELANREQIRENENAFS